MENNLVKLPKEVAQIAQNVSVENENMNDETFELFYETLKKAYNDRIEAERKAEEERIAREKAEAERKRKKRKSRS